MQTHARKKIEIIVDAPLVPRVTALIDRVGATGYTLFQSIGGRGAEGGWREDQLTGAQQKILIKVIAGDETAGNLVDALGVELERYSCIIYVSTVEVIRAGKF